MSQLLPVLNARIGSDPIRGDLRGAYDAFLAALDARLDACATDVVAAAAERGILA